MVDLKRHLVKILKFLVDAVSQLLVKDDALLLVEVVLLVNNVGVLDPPWDAWGFVQP